MAAVIAAHASPQVSVVTGGRIKHMTPTMNDVLRTVFDRVDVSHARQKSRVLIATGPRPADARRELAQWPRTERHDDLGLTVAAHGGVFAGTRIDIGTRFLVSQLDRFTHHGRVVDLACGNGTIGTWLAMRDRQLRVTATDRSATAVASASATARLNGVSDRITVTQANGLELQDNSSEARIVLNPPFHNDAAVSTDIARDLFTDAGRVLAPTANYGVYGTPTCATAHSSNAPSAPPARSPETPNSLSQFQSVADSPLADTSDFDRGCLLSDQARGCGSRNASVGGVDVGEQPRRVDDHHQRAGDIDGMLDDVRDLFGVGGSAMNAQTCSCRSAFR